MSFTSLLSHFSVVSTLPVPINDVLHWISGNTDHKIIKLHPVSRNHRAFRGGIRRKAISKTLVPYSVDYEIHTDILFGDDLEPEWKRLVICKELIHVFDPQGAQVSTPEAVKKLIPAIIMREEAASFWPAAQDHGGVVRALSILIPRCTRQQLAQAVDTGARSVTEVATLVQLPKMYVDFWLRYGDDLESSL